MQRLAANGPKFAPITPELYQSGAHSLGCSFHKSIPHADIYRTNLAWCVCVRERVSERVCVLQRGTENRYMQKESNSRMGSGQGTRIRSRKRDNRRPATEMSPTYVFPGMIGSSSDTVFKSGRVAPE